MCRLYSFRSTHPRKVECELIRAQNSLLAQSRCDARGEVNSDGWGLGHYEPDGELQIMRQAESAFNDPGFRAAAGAVFSTNVVAHVRKATVGSVRIENTHPFCWHHWLFAHNGTLAGFAAFRDDLLAAMLPEQRAAIRGDTDSEHVFHFLLSERQRAPGAPLLEVVAGGARQIVAFAEQRAPAAHFALNLLLTDGTDTAGVRWGPTLWFAQRPRVHPCEVCGGALHLGEIGGEAYRAVVVASERITQDEPWQEVPDRCAFAVDAAVRWTAVPL